MCAQGRLRSSWASAQSDQSFRCPHEESLCRYLPIERTSKTMIRLGGCPGWSESSLGAKIIFFGLVMRRLIYFRRTFAFKLKCSCWKKKCRCVDLKKDRDPIFNKIVKFSNSITYFRNRTMLFCNNLFIYHLPPTVILSVDEDSFWNLSWSGKSALSPF